MKKVSIKCRGAATVALDKLNEFQGELKVLSQENYERLKKEILELGFSEAISVWKDKKGKLFILNGHQRVRTVKQMVSEGISCAELPVTFVEADSVKQAKEKVLALTSQYGTMTKDGLRTFMDEAGLGIDDVARFNFPEINFDDFKIEFFSDVEKKEEPDKDGGVFDRTQSQYEESVIKQIVLFFDKERYEEMLHKLETLRNKFGAGDFSEVVGKLVDEATRS